MANTSTLTRRELLLSLSAIAVARRLVAQANRAPVRTLGLHHVVLAVSDVERSVDFYQGLFGSPIQGRQGSNVLLRLGDGPRFIALREAGSAPPRIDHWGMSVEEFDVENVLAALAESGVSRAAGGGPMSVRVETRAGTPQIFFTDPNGLVIQLQHPSYCGGSGDLGSVCSELEPSPRPGDLTLRELNHLTINVPDPAATNTFYQNAFGLDIQAHQAASPLLGVGPGGDFLMFIGAAEGTPARIGHVCFTVEGFGVETIQRTLEGHGIRPRGEGEPSSVPLRHWVSMRMPNRGGAPEGTPELYFSDPDGLNIQLQDATYCGGGGYLGENC
jgi:catechol 2,3-dioxygenase-like lactoylglutathione lyase family enzyme